jgi:hypothetical protein
VKQSTLRHGQHMQSLRAFYDRVVQEPIPIRFWELLEELPSFSDVSSGAGVSAEVGPTSLGSRNRHCGDGSLSIPDALAVSHNHHTERGSAPPAKLSTPWNRGGSRA